MEIQFLVSTESYFSKFKSFVGPDTVLYANPSLGAVFGQRSSVLTRLLENKQTRRALGSSNRQARSRRFELVERVLRWTRNM